MSKSVLKEFCKEANLSQNELAKKIGIQDNHILNMKILDPSQHLKLLKNWLSFLM